MVVYPNHALAQEHAEPLSLPVGFGLCTEVRNGVGCKEKQVWFILKLSFNYQSYGELESATCDPVAWVLCCEYNMPLAAGGPIKAVVDKEDRVCCGPECCDFISGDVPLVPRLGRE